MKTKAFKTILLAVFSLLLALPAMAQKGIEDGSKYGKGQDSINCIKNLSLYREFFKHNNYRDAIGPWRKVFGECPASSEKMYVEGITMYRSFIESASEGPAKESFIDTMLLIYDRRAEYFGGEGNILGRKGIDLLRYRRTDIDAVEEAYGYLKRSVELETSKSRDAVLVTYVNSSITLNKADRLTDNQSIDDYFAATAIVDELLGRSSRWERAKENIDELMLASGLLTCDALNGYFEPQFEANQNDTEFLQNVINFYSSSGCNLADLYIAAAEKMYEVDPGPESAHNLAYLFMRRDEYPRAAEYLKMAVIGQNIDSDTRAEWFYELAVVSSATEQFCDAISYAREAISYKNDMGKAYVLLGDAIIASRTNLGDEFAQRTAFWVAADKYNKARSVDPSVAQEAGQKLNNYASQYPDNEEIFFRDMKEGDSYQVQGCINEYTTVRARP